jgi:hypothetical protein
VGTSSETIFRPTVPSVPNSCFVEDDIEGRNADHTAAGKPCGLYIFPQGAFLSAVRFSDQKFVTLTKGYEGVRLLHLEPGDKVAAAVVIPDEEKVDANGEPTLLAVGVAHKQKQMPPERGWPFSVTQ